MKFNLHFTLLLLLPAVLTAGVERFLQPLDLEGRDQLYSLKKAGFLRSSTSKSYQSFNVSSKNNTFLTSDHLERLLSDSLKHRYQASGEIRVNLSTSWQPLKVSSSPIVKIRDISPDELSSSCFIRFSLWDSGQKLGDFSYPLRVASMNDVYFSTKNLNRGTKLNKEDFRLRKVDILKQHASSVSNTTVLKGFELQSNLNANSPLKWSILSKSTLIKKGQVIDVYASGNGIYVTMKGLALEDGVAESLVKVRNLSSDKEFHAKVLTESSVKVHL